MKQFSLLIFILFSAFILNGQEITVTGKVIAQDSGEPLPGVTILQVGTTTGTVTDMDGTYSINVPSDASLRYSYVGYLPQDIPVDGRIIIDIELLPDLLNLEEVIVVGYGIQKKSVVTGAIAKVTSEDLEHARDMRVEQSLQGKAAGVTIMSNSGQPGDNVSIRIRGTGTNSDPDPLFIIDGLPMEKEGLDYLSPSDIESIEVLKDASSSAIYGARGANGIIIITTKKGKKNEAFRASYEGYYGLQNPWKELDMLNAEEYMQIMNEAYQNDRSQNWFSDETMQTVRDNGWDTDWQSQMYNYNAPKTSHSFNFSGGGNASTYSSSINYFSQEGIVGAGKSSVDRVNFRLNTNTEIKKLTIGTNFIVTNIDKKGIDGNTQYGSGTNQAINMPPIVPVKMPDGSWGIPSDPLFGVGLQEITNPVALLDIINRNQNVNKAVANFSVDWEILDGLVFRTNYGTEYAFVNNREYIPVYYIDATHRRDSVDKAIHSVDKYVRWNLENTLTFRKQVGDHNLVVLAGMTHFKEWSEDIYAARQDLIFDDLEHAYLNNANILIAEASGGFNEHTIKSYFGRLNYNFQEKYLLEAVFRADGSSRFGPANKYGYFPAVSAGWVISREAFFPQNDVLNFTKLRVSWGQIGNENIGDFRYTSLMSNNALYFFGVPEIMYNGIQPAFYANAGLKWETSQQLDAGIDMAFYNNRLSLTIDYYDKRTKDWLVDAPAMAMIGNIGPTINGGEVKNSGVEMELNFKDNVTSSLRMNASITGAWNRSEVLNIENEEGVLEGGSGIHGQAGIIRAEIGMPLGYFYAFKTEGLFTDEAEFEDYPWQPSAKLGDLKFADMSGDSLLTDEDRVYLGDPNPDLVLGINFGFDWKFIDFNMFWYSALGHQIYMANRRADLKYANFTTDVLDHWSTDNPESTYPNVTLSDRNRTWIRPSDFYVRDASYLRLKSISLGVTLPKQVTNFLRVERLRIYVMGENILTLTKYPGLEVEMGGGPFDIGIDHGIYPHPRTFLGGVNITF